MIRKQTKSRRLSCSICYNPFLGLDWALPMFYCSETRKARRSAHTKKS